MEKNLKGTWPIIVFEKAKDTLTTVQLWMQVVGKIRLRKMPWLNHSWHVTLYVSPKGFTTSSIPYEQGIFEIEFDFINHQLLLVTSTGKSASFSLVPMSVAKFYQQLFEKLEQVGVAVNIHHAPNEIDPAVPFEKDNTDRNYDAEQILLFWQAVVKVHIVFTRFKASFTGKASPVHFFWGAFDLAYTRFSGREAPEHPGEMPNMPKAVMQEAYSHEVSSCGFWPGSEAFPQAVFYAYCYPTPDAYKRQPVSPTETFYSEELGEYFLPYEAVRNSPNPESTLLSFLQTTYEAAANTANWDRSTLECDLTHFEK
ncbi:MAG: DUF5996 family protein [Bacteroidota bacterium]